MTADGNPSTLARLRPLLLEEFRDRTMGAAFLEAIRPDFESTVGQKSFESPARVRMYEWFRERLLPIYLGTTHQQERALAAERIELRGGDVVVDLSCGQGNFSLDFARRVGSSGMVVGIDIARAMLERAAERRDRAGASNLTFVRADALDLPLRSGVVRKLYCSGGLHQFPDLERAMSEVARVCAPGARIAMSGFAREGGARETSLDRHFRRFEMQVVSLGELNDILESCGFTQIESSTSRFSLGHIWARRG